MSKKILLIGVNEVKTNTIIESNVDEKVIINSIQEVQDLEVLPVIGKTTLNRLKSEIEQTIIQSGYTLSTSDATLINDFIRPFLTFGVLVYSFIPIHYKFTNKGMQKKTDNNSQLIDAKELELLRQHYSVKFQNYKKRLVEYLCEDNDSSTNAEPNQDTTYTNAGWFLDDSTGFDLENYYYQQKRRY